MPLMIDVRSSTVTKPEGSAMTVSYHSILYPSCGADSSEILANRKRLFGRDIIF